MRTKIFSTVALVLALMATPAFAQFNRITPGQPPSTGCSSSEQAIDPTNNVEFVCSPSAGWASVATGAVLPNATSTGTTLNKLAKLTGVGTALIAATTDNKSGAVLGVVRSGAGTSGSAFIQTSGLASCVFDGATTANDFVTVSTGTAGDCTDFGSSIPTDGSQLIGRVLSTNGSGGTYSVFLTHSRASSGVGNGNPVEVYNTAQTAGTSSISATTIYTPAVAGNYRISYYLTQTVVGASCAGNTTVQVAVKYQDSQAAAGQVVNLGLHTISAASGNGAVGVVPWTSGPTTWTFQSGATAIQIQTTYSAGGSCSPSPAVQLIPVLEAF